MQWFLSDPKSGWLTLEMHHLALTTAKKTLDENRFKNAQKTTDCTPTSFEAGNRVHSKNKQPGKWDLKWRARYRIVHTECNGHYLHIKKQATGKTQSCSVKDVVHKPPIKLWNIDTQYGIARRFKNYPANLPIITWNTNLKRKKTSQTFWHSVSDTNKYTCVTLW